MLFPDSRSSSRQWSGADELGHEFGPASRRPQHVVRLGGVHRHTCLTKHMLAGAKRGQRYRVMHVRPGPDDDGVDAIIVDQVSPRPVDGCYLEPTSHCSGGIEGPITDGGYLHALDRKEPGDVAILSILPSADDPYAKGLRAGRGCDRRPPFVDLPVWTAINRSRWTDRTS